jgi:hypothetical protein
VLDPKTKPEGYDELMQKLIDRVSPEERLRGLPVEERLRGIPAEERLRGLRAPLQIHPRLFSARWRPF